MQPCDREASSEEEQRRYPFSIYLIFNVDFVPNCMLTIIISFELSCPDSDFI
jgi:hypothetical protein